MKWPWLSLWLWLSLLLPALALASPPPLPVYPGATHTRIGGELLAGGERMRLAYFTTRDPLPQVAEHFARAWTEQGLPVVVDGDLAREGVVSAFHTRDGLQLAVVLVTRRGKTLGFTALKDLWLPATPPPPPPPEEPLVPEGTLLGQELLAPGEPGATRLRTALVERDLQAAATAIDASLSRQGFRRARARTLDGRQDGHRRLLLEHASGQERVSTSLAELEPGLVAILQTRTRQGNTP